ncbi:hypothetical protein M407DRAFT_107936 [Tulasnella calospora MUT 4182]|uniref:Uncharacterized protein n=1 Tax=Tulasnella calospora MUT 4182 TaxID=1051891 RepID=A0A0C3KQF7_9AGAM|nr:hypothetical protein M407DRAFT_107936 [Tulasnella calospora MUT 4182]
MPAAFTSTNAASAPMPQKPLVSHVNMQLDSFLANSNIDDLRAIVRCLLATGPVDTTSAFTKIARSRVSTTAPRRTHPPSAFFAVDSKGSGVPTNALWETITAARILMGVGLGFESLPILVSIVDTARAYKYEPDSDMEDALVVIDADIAQALQSCREQLASGDNLVKHREAARETLDKLRNVLAESRRDIEVWGGEFPFEKGELAIQGWKL